jgi:hypothetical protein
MNISFSYTDHGKYSLLKSQALLIILKRVKIDDKVIDKNQMKICSFDSGFDEINL